MGYSLDVFCTPLVKTQNASGTCELPAHPEHGHDDVSEQAHVGSGENHTLLRLFYKCDDGYDTSERKIRRKKPVAPVGGGWRARSRELPWHVGIYDKLYKPYMQICGGSIISAELVVTGWLKVNAVSLRCYYCMLRRMKETKKVFMGHDEYLLSFHRVVATQTLRAAHCFWSDVKGLAPSSRFAVSAEKLFRPWSAPSHYRAQLRDVTGWGFIDEDGHASPDLQVVHLPYVEIDQCIDNASPDFRTYITSDKICAGYTNGQSQYPAFSLDLINAGQNDPCLMATSLACLLVSFTHRILGHSPVIYWRTLLIL
ncbi:hypothetical protein EVAR_65417_1 [Eumeta japonica]|uniref:Peptidase S1 domain-containing protein n=1 Tax=Eumeta variegata TaxID=151549 RepID=A0A4C1YN58_EUMVA|nr:hypothetical protein EVAR_65417_1 [Eumeta japonica]